MGLSIVVLLYILPIVLTFLEVVVSFAFGGSEAFWIAIPALALLIRAYVTLHYYRDRSTAGKVAGHIDMGIMAAIILFCSLILAIVLNQTTVKTSNETMQITLWAILCIVSTTYIYGLPIYGFYLYETKLHKEQEKIRNAKMQKKEAEADALKKENAKIIKEGKSLISKFENSAAAEELINQIIANVHSRCDIEYWFPKHGKEENAKIKNKTHTYEFVMTKEGLYYLGPISYVERVSYFNFEQNRMKDLSGLSEQYAFLECIRGKVIASMEQKDGFKIAFTKVDRTSKEVRDIYLGDDEWSWKVIKAGDKMTFNLTITVQNPDYIEVRDW